MDTVQTTAARTQHIATIKIHAIPMMRQFFATCLFSGLGSLFHNMKMIKPMMMLNESRYKMYLIAPNGSCGCCGYGCP
jgi:hypothetical protein